MATKTTSDLKAQFAGADPRRQNADLIDSIPAMSAPVVDIAGNVTLTALQSGSLFRVTAANAVVTLPATAAGLRYSFVLAAAGLSAAAGLALSPAAADKIMGNGFTAADNKDAILAGASDREGDAITLVGDGVDGWYIESLTGTWAREA